MLTELQIKNFSIIESTQVHFQKGFHALSGETGAGKSFLVQALNFSLGARADSESIRAGAKEASVTAIFEDVENPVIQTLCEELGVDLKESGGNLYLRRTLNDSGRSRAFLNDQGVTMKSLQNLGRGLVHQVGQFAAQQLLDELFLFQLLDQFGGHDDILKKYQEAYRHHQVCQEELKNLQLRIKESREQEDYLRFQHQELNDANLREGEEEELESQKQRMKHRAALANQTFEMNQYLQESEDSLSDRLAKVVALGEKTQSLDESLASTVGLLSEALERVDMAAGQFRDYGLQLQEEPETFDRLETRLARIHELKRKYRLEEAELIAKREDLNKALGELEDVEVNLEDKTKDLKTAEAKLKKLGKELREKRIQAGAKISVQLKKNLKELSLPQAKIQWVLTPYPSLPEYKLHGGETLSLLVSFNPGEELRPFQEVISGGELSRLLLAIYEVLYPANQFGSFIFDEVDAGVSGSVAELIGKKLARLSRETQVLCITHLPQIASQAKWHYAVEKEFRGGRTYSEIRLLKDEERVKEIARMLAGVEVTDQALKHAKELLKNTAA